MSRALVPALGWTATSFFVVSYFFDRPATLRAIQMIRAMPWVIYGGLIGARPVMAANALVSLPQHGLPIATGSHGRSPG